MTFTLESLIRDVFALLGESSGLPRADSAVDIPDPRDIVGRMVACMLPRVGSRIIWEATPAMLCGAEPVGVEVHKHLAQCGLHAADIALPAGFLRLVSVKMGEWKREVCRVFSPGEQEWDRQWSEEPGIAGSPQCPQAYLSHCSDGGILRLIGSVGADDTLEWFRCCLVPVPDEDGVFSFPPHLYGELVEAVAVNIR